MLILPCKREKGVSYCKVCKRNTDTKNKTNLVNPSIVDGVCNGFIFSDKD